MTAPDDQDGGRMTGREAERQKRLRDALRENLKRRKSQSRKRAVPPKVGSEPDEVADRPDDER